MKRVLIATEKPFAPEAREKAVRIMRDAGLEVVVLESYTSKNQLLEKIKDVNAVIFRSDIIDKEVLDATSELELAIRGGAGVDNINHLYAEEKGVIVENTPGQNSIAVAELAFELMLQTIRPLDGKTGTELYGKTLGIHGFGNVGKLVAERAKGFNMPVNVYDIHLDEKKADELNVMVIEDLDTLYFASDFITLHIPETEKTKDSINFELLSQMHENTVLINTARKGLVDEEGLLKILEEKPGFRYATDVKPSEETMRIIQEKFKDRVIWTPKKQGAQTKEANERTILQAAAQCIGYFNEGVVLNNVNNPLPAEKRGYITLAQTLARFNQAFIETPNKVVVTCYGDLGKYEKQLASYVLKGLFQKHRGAELTPAQALEDAEAYGIELKFREADNSKGYGDSITVEYVTDEISHSIRGRVDGKEIQINRINDFNISLPLEAGMYVVAEYAELAGMADRIGSAFTAHNYNKSVGGFRPDAEGKRAIFYSRVEKAEASVKELENIIKNEVMKIKGMKKAHVIDLR